MLAIPLFYLGRRSYKLKNSIQEEHNLKNRILILQAENEVLKNRISDYKNGEFVEAKARNDLGMIKENEKVYIIFKK